MRPVPAIVFPLTKEFEGLKLARYLDPVGIPTIGYGHVIRPNDPPWGTINEATADELLAKDLAEAASELCVELGPLLVDPLTDGQYGALIDFVFNEGIGRFATSTMCHLIQTGNLSAVAAQFPRWVYGRVNGQMKALPGLVKRRAAEQAMWLS